VTDQAADDTLSARLRDLALVELDALVLGAGPELLAAFAGDVADALTEARARIAALRAQLGGADPLNVLDLSPRQRGGGGAGAPADRIRGRLSGQAEAARTLARLADLAGALVPKLFEVDRRL
jgi:hypothetical protein